MKSKVRLQNSGLDQILCKSTKARINIRAGAYCEPRSSQEIQTWILEEIAKAEKRGRSQSKSKTPKVKKPSPKVDHSAKTGDLTAFKIPKRSLYERRRDPSPVIARGKPK